jgi:hypothetical protein
MITQFFNAIITSVLFFDMLERRYPVEFNNILMQSSFNCIYFYSKLQISAYKFKKNVNQFIENNPTLSKIRNDIYLSTTIVNNKNSLEYVKCGIVSADFLKSYDLKIFSYYLNDTNNKQIITNSESLSEIGCCENSDIKFMLIEVTVGENTYKVDLKTDSFNYYISGNKFNKQFFIFYLKHHLTINELIDNNTKMQVKIIDHDVNRIDLDFSDNNEYILLEKNGYKLEITNKPISE